MSEVLDIIRAFLAARLDRNLPTPKTIGQLLEIVGELRTATAVG